MAYLQPFSVQVTLAGLSSASVDLVIDGHAYPPAISLTPVLVIGMPVQSTATFLIPGAQIPAAAVGNVLPPRNNHQIGVNFSGDSSYLPQLFTANQVPLNIAPLVTLMSSANPATAGQLIQFTASINVGPSVSPTGTVSFFEPPDATGEVTRMLSRGVTMRVLIALNTAESAIKGRNGSIN